MPGGRSGLYPGIEKKHQSAQYKQYEAENDLLLDVGRDRLLELAQAEKEGRLVVLPFKVGDTVWTNMSIVGDRYKSVDRPYPVVVVFIGMGEVKRFFHVLYSNGRVFPFDFDGFGKTVFLAREEAEAALKKREETI